MGERSLSLWEHLRAHLSKGLTPSGSYLSLGVGCVCVCFFLQNRLQADFALSDPGRLGTCLCEVCSCCLHKGCYQPLTTHRPSTAQRMSENATMLAFIRPKGVCDRRSTHCLTWKGCYWPWIIAFICPKWSWETASCK